MASGRLLPLHNCWVWCDMKYSLHIFIIMGLEKRILCITSIVKSWTDLLPWETLPDAPNEYLAAAFFGGRLLSIGGWKIL